MELVCKLDTAFHSPLGDVAAFGVVIVCMLAHYAVCGRQWMLLERGRSEVDLEAIASTDPTLCPGHIYIYLDRFLWELPKMVYPSTMHCYLIIHYIEGSFVSFILETINAIVCFVPFLECSVITEERNKIISKKNYD